MAFNDDRSWKVNPGQSVEDMLRWIRRNSIDDSCEIHFCQAPRNDDETSWWENGEWIPLLRAIQGRDEVNQLLIEEMHLDRKAVHAFVEFFSKRNAALERVLLGFCHFQESWCSTSFMMAMAHHVERLDVFVRQEGEHDSPDGYLWALGNVLTMTPCLRSLSIFALGVEERLSSDAMVHLARGIGANQTLENLHLWGFIPAHDAVDHVLEAFAHYFRRTQAPLWDLDCGGCGDEIVAEKWCTAVQHLRTLKKLHLGCTSCPAYNFRGLAPVLQLSLLEELDLSSEGSDEDKIDITFLMECLKENTSVQKLLLPQNDLDDHDANLMVRMLQINRSLHTLFIHSNAISDQGIIEFAECMPQMHGLRELYLKDNPFTVKGALALLQAMRISTNIMWMGIHDEFGGDKKSDKDIKTQVQYYAVLNQGGRQLLLQPNSGVGTGSLLGSASCQLEPALWPHVLARLNGSDWLSIQADYLVIRNPSVQAIHFFVAGVIPLLLQQQQH